MKDIFKLATDAGFKVEKYILSDDGITTITHRVKLLVKLALNQEREELAKLCESLELKDNSFYGDFSSASDCAREIRERIEK
jgi:hypothetical protein